MEAVGQRGGGGGDDHAPPAKLGVLLLMGGWIAAAVVEILHTLAADDGDTRILRLKDAAAQASMFIFQNHRVSLDDGRAVAMEQEGFFVIGRKGRDLVDDLKMPCSPRLGKKCMVRVTFSQVWA